MRTSGICIVAAVLSSFLPLDHVTAETTKARSPRREDGRATPAATFEDILRDAMSRERRASGLVTELDARFRDDDFRHGLELVRLSTSADEKRRFQTTATDEFLKLEDELFADDQRLDAEISQLFRTASSSGAGAIGLQVRTALFQWTVLVRRGLMRSLHTEVPGLEGDPDCVGDVVTDQMLLRYINTLFDSPPDDPTPTFAATADLARQSACMGAQQHALWSRALAESYADLETYLRMSGLRTIEPYVANAAFQPMLLAYDVEKYRGPDTPLAAWFMFHGDELIEMARAKRAIVEWHRLWLYDRVSGRLLGFRPVAAAVDENQVELIPFIQSITHAENLGGGACSFSEMVGRGTDADGYHCNGRACGGPSKVRDLGPAPAGRPSGGSSAGRPSPTASLPPSTETLFTQLQETVCNLGTADERAGNRPGCGGTGAEIAGSMRSTNMIQCVSAQIIRPGTEGFACLAELTGRCSNPAGGLTKELRQTTFAGVKMGRDCGVASGSGDPLADARDAALDAARAAVAARAEADLLRAAADEARWKQYDEAMRFMTAKREERGTDEEEAAKAGAAIREAREAEAKAREAEKAAREALQKALEAEAKAREAERKAREAKAEEEKKQKELEAARKKASGQKRCVADDMKCTDNDCTAMGRWTKSALDCARKAIAPEQRDAYRPSPLGCDPRYCDPMDPARPAGQGRTACFGDTNENTTEQLSRLCWSVRCADGQVATARNGQCVCSEPGMTATGTEASANPCAQMRCAEGSPHLVDGHCSCEGAVNVGELPRTGPLPTIGIALRFSDANARDFSEGSVPGYPPPP
jgi:hypothetical protein